jgi:hypothetical protein
MSVGANTYAQMDSASGTTNNFSTLVAPSIQGAARYQWREFLSFAVDFSITAFPIPIGPTGNAIRFLDFNAQVIYPLPFIQGPWKLELLADYSYRTSFPSQYCVI